MASCVVAYFVVARRASGDVGFTRATKVGCALGLAPRTKRSGTVRIPLVLPSPAPPSGFSFGPAENRAGRETGGSGASSLSVGDSPTTAAFSVLREPGKSIAGAATAATFDVPVCVRAGGGTKGLATEFNAEPGIDVRVAMAARAGALGIAETSVGNWRETVGGGTNSLYTLGSGCATAVVMSIFACNAGASGRGCNASLSLCMPRCCCSW